MMDEILKITQGQPFIVVLLLLAVYWMTRNNAVSAIAKASGNVSQAKIYELLY
jgi:hypothetical protein